MDERQSNFNWACKRRISRKQRRHCKGVLTNYKKVLSTTKEQGINEVFVSPYQMRPSVRPTLVEIKVFENVHDFFSRLLCQPNSSSIRVLSLVSIMWLSSGALLHQS